MSHEPFFCLLREVVTYGKGGKGQPSREVLDNPCAESFVLLHIECACPGPLAAARAAGCSCCAHGDGLRLEQLAAVRNLHAYHTAEVPTPAERRACMRRRLLREYFGLEFGGVKLPWAGKVDLERVVDDFVLLCMFTGNDFLPGAPDCLEALGGAGSAPPCVQHHRLGSAEGATVHAGTAVAASRQPCLQLHRALPAWLLSDLRPHADVLRRCSPAHL